MMTNPLSFGTSPAAAPQPRTSLGFGSMSEWGQPASAASMWAGQAAPVPAPAPSPVPVPGPAMQFNPGSPVAAPQAPGIAPIPQNEGAGVDAADPAAERGWLGKTFMHEGGGANIQAMGTALQGVGALGSLWSAFQQNRLAKDAFKFQRDTHNTNMRSQVQSYNTSLEDRVRARYSQEGRSAEAADAYIEKNRLSR